jgi:CRISPR/Cas system CMR subunit Cmr4 (Cas7 group RAMP superfamily)
MKSRQLEISFHCSFHHGNGFGIAGLIDRAVLRDSYGMPYLAGSAIKGKFRHAALRLLLSQGQQACEYGDSPRGCAPCPLCRMFGSRLRRGALIFSDAQPDALFENVLSGPASVCVCVSLGRQHAARRLYGPQAGNGP